MERNQFAVQQYQMSSVQNLKGKIIEHYSLTNQFKVTPLAQFWYATHKVLKKDFIVKKITSSKSQSSDLNAPENQIEGLKLAKQEIALLSSLKLQGIPKCQKLIRTATSIYIVYNQFPRKSLQNLLDEGISCPIKVLEKMLMISDQLEKVHKAGVVLLNLSESNILFDDSNQPFFCDWTVAKKINGKYSEQVIQMLRELPNYVKKNMLASTSIDVFQLGKVFGKILGRTKSSFSSKVVEKLDLVVNSMTNENQEETMDISGVSKLLKQIVRISSLEESPKKVVQPLFSSCQVAARINQIKELNRLTKVKSEKQITKTPAEITQSSKTILLEHHRKRSKSGGDLVNLDLKSTTVKKQPPKPENTKKSDAERKVKITLPKRQYISFLLDMVLFTQSLNIELAFMLLSKAKESIYDLRQVNESLRKSNVVLYAQINNIIKGEVARVDAIIALVKQRCHELKNCEAILKTKSVSAKQINNLIRNLIEEQLKNPLSNMNFTEKNNHLFNLFMLSRSIKYGSFERFWISEYDPEISPLAQTFTTKDKCLGMRYLRGSLEQVIKLK